MWIVCSILLLLLSFCGLSASATSRDSLVVCGDTSVVMRFRIYYPVNKTTLYPQYMGNEQALQEIRTYLSESPRIDSITIYSYASPEGPYRFNRWLAGERGKTAKQYLLEQVPADRHFPDSLIRLNPMAENWEGLREEILSGYHRADREEVLRILDDASLSDARKKQLLRRLARGASWRYILRHFMPRLRYATWISVWRPIPRDLPLPAVQPPRPVVTERPAPVMQPVPVVHKDTRTILALKTNLLYDVASLLNFAVEVPLYKDKVSLLYQHHFPWWTWGKGGNEYCIRFLSFGGEARWWFRPMPRPAMDGRVKRDRLMGHYLGLYGMGGKWDFERKRDICHQGEFWSAGLSYGYAMPIGKRLNLEFSVSAGYASIPYRGYTPSEGYEVLIRDPEKVGTWHYFGLTKAEVSLVIPITITVKKGGRL